MTEIKRDIVRDLMRVAYAWADEPVCPVSGRSGALEIAIRDALRAALAKSQPVEQGEPYAYANGFGDLFKNRDEIEGVATELFTHPVRPLTDAQIEAAFEKVASLHAIPVNGGSVVLSALVGVDQAKEFARAIEAHIKGATE